MQIDLTTPALLFPAISLLLLAYTNRFVTLAHVIRALYADYQKQPDASVLAQIHNLNWRVNLIRAMQGSGVLSLFFCSVSMFSMYLDHVREAAWLFGLSLVLMMVSLAFSVWEIHISTVALKILLQDIQTKKE